MHFYPFKILFLVVSGIYHRALNILGKCHSIAELHPNSAPFSGPLEWGKELSMELFQLGVEKKSIFFILFQFISLSIAF